MKVAFIYVNPVEYHGPHLPLQTDYEISRGLSRELLTRLKKSFPHEEIEVAQTIEIHRGCDPAHGPGTEFTTLKELKKIVLEKSQALLREFRPDFVFFLTFHGAPKHAAAIQTGVDFFSKQGIPAYNPFNFVLKKLRDYEPSLAEPMAHLIPDEAFRRKYIQRLPEDFHGGLFESSVLMHLNPTAVKSLHRDLPDCEDRQLAWPWKFLISLARGLRLKTFSRELAIGADAIGWANLPSYPGYTGAPRFASGEIGRYFTEVILDDYERGFLRMVNEKKPSPKPILQWTVFF